MAKVMRSHLWGQVTKWLWLRSWALTLILCLPSLENPAAIILAPRRKGPPIMVRNGVPKTWRACEKITFGNPHMSQLRNASLSPSRVLRWVQSLLTAWLQPQEKSWNRGNNGVARGFLNHRNCRIINICYFGYWSFSAIWYTGIHN